MQLFIKTDACEQMGVSSYSFQQKFGISGIDVKLLANRGMLKITGKGRLLLGAFRNDGQEQLL